MHPEPPRSQSRGIHHGNPIRGTDDDHVAELLHAIELGQKLIHDSLRRPRTLMIAISTMRQHRVELIEEHDAG